MRVPSLLLGALLLLALSACAPTRSGVVLRADDWNDTLRIDGQVYLLTPHTELYDADGHPIRLHQVPTIADPGVGVRHPSRARVDFLARELRGRWYLDRLWLQPREAGSRQRIGRDVGRVLLWSARSADEEPMSIRHLTRRRPLRAASVALCFLCFLVAPALATAQAVKNGSSVKRTVRRNNATYDKFKSDVDDYVDDADERRVESREDWQDYWNEDDERRERARLQELRAGSHGKSCIYGANGEVIHAPEGAICDRAPGARPASDKP